VFDFGSVDAVCDAAPPKKLRSMGIFNWTTHCFYCGKVAGLSDVYHCARTIPLRKTVLEVCEKRQDQWALDVKTRMQLCNDLPAADAVYHHKCQLYFYCSKLNPMRDTDVEAGATLGRPIDSSKMAAFVWLCEWLECCDDNELHTLEDLRQIMITNTGDESSVYCVCTKTQTH